MHSAPHNVKYLACRSNNFVLQPSYQPSKILKENYINLASRKYEGGHIWINPSNKKVTPNAIGLFITESSDAAKRAWFFCR